MERLYQDIRFGLRMLWKSRSLTVIAVIALALGIGANTAIFSVVNAVLLRPLPYPNPDQLVMVKENFLQQGFKEVPISIPEFRDYREQNSAFQEVAGFFPVTANVTGGDQPERAQAIIVTTNFFDLLGVKPIMGRTFEPADDRNGIGDAAVISYGMWQRKFGGDPNVVGKKFTVDTDPFTVIGVMPRSFVQPAYQGRDSNNPVDLWSPTNFNVEQLPHEVRGARFVYLIGRMKPNLTLAQAQANINTITENLQQQYPDAYAANSGWSASVVPLLDHTVGQIRTMLWVLLGVVGLVLLIACANVANLLIARTATREKEIAIRLALGAKRIHLVRQFLTESVLLAMLGGLVGIFLALWGTDLLVAASPIDLPRVGEISVDGKVLVFTFALSLITGIVFGLAPAIQSIKNDVNETLKEGGRNSLDGPKRNRLRSGLVVVELALSLILLIGAGLLIKSFQQLNRVELGFNTQNLLALQISLPVPNDAKTGKYFKPEVAEKFFQSLLEHIASLPGVRSVGATTNLPLTGFTGSNSFVIEDRQPNTNELPPTAALRIITPAYFQTMGITLVKGRELNEQDQHDQSPVAIVNETLAQRYWPNDDAIGKRIKFPGAPIKWITIVGIVHDARTITPEQIAQSECYVSYHQLPVQAMGIVVRTTGDPTKMINSLRAAVRDIDNDQPIYNTYSYQELVARITAQRRFNTFLITIFAVVALLLASVGIYGVMSYSVTQRTHEIGIRMALGAQPADVLKMVIRQGLNLILMGVTIGLIGAFLLTRFISSLLFEVTATDTATFMIISVLLVAVAMLASYLPARKATQVDPIIALRS